MVTHGAVTVAGLRLSPMAPDLITSLFHVPQESVSEPQGKDEFNFVEGEYSWPMY